MNWPAVITSLRKQANTSLDEADAELRTGNLTTANGHFIVGSVLHSLATALIEGIRPAEIESYTGLGQPMFPPKEPSNER
jgi:hypothetical protein